MSGLAWTDLPAGLRTSIEAALGGEVATAVSQGAGFSPGSADRVVLTDGRREPRLDRPVPA